MKKKSAETVGEHILHMLDRATYPHYQNHRQMISMWEDMGIPFREAKQRLKNQELFLNSTYAKATAPVT